MTKSIMKVMIGKVKFPEICPVCTQVADDVTTMTLNDNTFLDVSPSSGMLVKIPSIAGRYRHHNYTSSSGTKRIIRVPTCELHKHKEIRDAFKTFWFLMSVISIAPILFLLYGTTNAIYYGGDVLLNLFGLILVAGTVSALTAFIHYPRPFQRAFEIIGFRSDNQEIYLRIQNPTYLAEFLTINEMFVSVIGEKEYHEMKRKKRYV